MRLALVSFLPASVAAGAVDLAHKAASDPTYVHERTVVYVVVVVLLLAAWSSAIVATRSVPVSVAGGIVAGGGLGNVASLALWPGVPNPILVDAVAFNLADVFVVFGFAVTATAVLVHAARNRDRLRQPVDA